jgi:hypothetical protein
MISLYLSSRSLAAARAVDPHVSPAAVHAAVEVAIVGQLREIAGCSQEEIRTRAERGDG